MSSEARPWADLVVLAERERVWRYAEKSWWPCRDGAGPA